MIKNNHKSLLRSLKISSQWATKELHAKLKDKTTAKIKDNLLRS